MRNVLIAPAAIAATLLTIGLSGCTDTAPLSDSADLPNLAIPEPGTADNDKTVSGQ